MKIYRSAVFTIAVTLFGIPASAQTPDATPADVAVEVEHDRPVPQPSAPFRSERAKRIFNPASLAVTGADQVNGTAGDIFLDATSPFVNAGVWLQPKVATPDVAVKLGTADTDADFTIFNRSEYTLLTVRGNGRIGVNTYTPAARFHVISNDDLLTAFYTDAFLTIDASTQQNDVVVMMDADELIPTGVSNTGTLTGTQERTYMRGGGSLTALVGNRIVAGISTATGSTGSVAAVYGSRITVLQNGGSIATGIALRLDDVTATTPYGIYQAGTDDRNHFLGSMRVGGAGTSTWTEKFHVLGTTRLEGTTTITGANTIGTGQAPADLTVSGSVQVSQNITGSQNSSITGFRVLGAVYQDVAEWVPATTYLPPGTVVVLNPAKNNEVMASFAAYDTSVAGVVSQQPGVILGNGGEGQLQVAILGRVKVRVDARTAPVRVGDLLVTSDIEGTAMRSQPMELNGRKFHQPGTIIGKALEPLERGVGEILVLLSMQ